MAFDNKTTLILISAALALAIIVFVYLGCACRKPWEGFEDAQATKPNGAVKVPVATSASSTSDAVDLTPKEKELFEDLKENRITDQRLSELIKNGTINEQVVTKFLNQLTSQAEKFANAKTATVPEATESAPETFYAHVPGHSARPGKMM